MVDAVAKLVGVGERTRTSPHRKASAPRADVYTNFTTPTSATSKCPGRESNSHAPHEAAGFEPAVSTCSTTRAWLRCQDSNLGCEGQNLECCHYTTPHYVLDECPERELNPHTFRYRNLNPACLPVPPSGRAIGEPPVGFEPTIIPLYKSGAMGH